MPHVRTAATPATAGRLRPRLLLHRQFHRGSSALSCGSARHGRNLGAPRALLSGLPGSLRLKTLAICICIALTGCSQRDGAQRANSAAGDGDLQSIGGVWNGADASGRPILGLADEAGEFNLIRDDGLQYAGTASIRGNAVSAKARRLTRAAGAKGSEDDAATLTGKGQQHQSLSLRIVPAAGAQPFPGDTVTLQFNPLYDTPSSLARFAGEYMDDANGNAVTVTAGGALFWRDERNGCLANGAVSLIDGHHDLYEVQFSYSACQGSYAGLNGVQFSGLGTLESSLQPAQAIIGVTGESGGRGYGIDLKLSRLPPRSPI